MKMPEKVHEMVEPVDEPMLLKHGIQKWAADNAFTLFFILVMFVITWGVILITTAWEVANGH